MIDLNDISHPELRALYVVVCVESAIRAQRSHFLSVYGTEDPTGGRGPQSHPFDHYRRGLVLATRKGTA